MEDLKTYNSLRELKEYFDVEYINTVCDFYALLKQVQEKKNTLYRGVCSPRYKMYSSSQRFYCDNKNAFNFEYTGFISKLYDVSPSIDNGYLLKLYSDLQKDNYIQYVNTDKGWKSERIYLPYNPIWAFYTLQHFTQCSPFLDFSEHFYIALYFATQEMSTLWCDNFSKEEIDNYIEIISINDSLVSNTHNFLTMKEKYKSLTDDYFNDKNPIENIYHSPYYNYTDNDIKYVNYSGSCKIIGSGWEYRFSFKNENCIAQSGRLFLTSGQYDKPFEILWNENINSQKLKLHLIHKSLIDEIFNYLNIHLLGKVVVPIQKDYKNEIIELVKSIC